MFTEYKMSAADVSERSIQFAKSINMAAPGQNPVQFAAKVIADRIHVKPASYLEFGPYWWAVKRALRGAGFDLGKADDAIIGAAYGGELHDFAAMVAGEDFKDLYRATWFVGNRKFELDAEGGETYVLMDADMEARMLGAPIVDLASDGMDEHAPAEGVALDSVDVHVPRSPFRVEFERAGELWTADIYAGGRDEAQCRLDELESTGQLDSAIDLGQRAGEPFVSNGLACALHVDASGRHLFEVGPAPVSA